MEVVWLGGHVNEQIAAYLKNRGIIDDYEANAAYVRIIINKPSVTIDRMEVQRIVELIIGKKYDYDEFSKIWFAMWANVYGGKVDKISESSVTLISTEEKAILSVRIPKKLKERLEEKARTKKTSLTDVVIDALTEYLEKES